MACRQLVIAGHPHRQSFHTDIIYFLALYVNKYFVHPLKIPLRLQRSFAPGRNAHQSPHPQGGKTGHLLQQAPKGLLLHSGLGFLPTDVHLQEDVQGNAQPRRPPLELLGQAEAVHRLDAGHLVQNLPHLVGLEGADEVDALRAEGVACRLFQKLLGPVLPKEAHPLLPGNVDQLRWHRFGHRHQLHRLRFPAGGAGGLRQALPNLPEVGPDLLRC